jgi:hypothetical protein
LSVAPFLFRTTSFVDSFGANILKDHPVVDVNVVKLSISKYVQTRQFRMQINHGFKINGSFSVVISIIVGKTG